MNRIRLIFIVLITASLLASCTCSVERSGDMVTTVETKQLLFETGFSQPLDGDLWKIEMEELPNSSVTVKESKLILDTKGGVTVWLNKKLKGNLEISYKRQVVVADGVNDRLSDLNQFWMATDPGKENLFTRGGKFAEYDSLSMYYVGFGGNYNSTTRFREYQGDGEKTLLFDLDDEPYLLQPNHWYDIRIEVKDGATSYYVDGEKFFEYQDESPLEEGYFGFRSTWSHHEIDSLRIYYFEKPDLPGF